MAYSLATSYVGESLLSGFNWFDGADPSHGHVAYQSRENADAMGLFSVDEDTNVVRLGVDYTRTYPLDQGRPSIRLESKQAYNHGLYIADFLHMPPSQCGLWPAFWAYGGDWPNGGEIDVIEGVNTAHNNIISAHTSEGCTQNSALSGLYSGEMRNTECGVGDMNVGCGFNPPTSDASSYGDGFNAVNGGVYAMEWDSKHISVWHFPRGSIPADIEAKNPQPDGWGKPQAVFGGSGCDVDTYYKNMSIVINTNFCGDYGGPTWGTSGQCASLAPTCNEYVSNYPQAFTNAYWDVKYIDAYQMSDDGDSSPLPSSSSSSSSPSPTPTPADNINNGKHIDLNGHSPPLPPTPASAGGITNGKHFGLGGGNSSALPSASSPRPRPSMPPYPAGNSTAGNSTLSTGVSSKPTSTTTMTSKSTTTVKVGGKSFATASSSPEEAVANPARIGDHAYLGCFGSNTGFPSFQKSDESEGMTIAMCVESCSGMKYAGVFDTQCYCAETLDADTRAGASELCDHQCPGNDAEFCGGLAKNLGFNGKFSLSGNMTRQQESSNSTGRLGGGPSPSGMPSNMNATAGNSSAPAAHKTARPSSLALPMPTGTPGNASEPVVNMTADGTMDSNAGFRRSIRRHLLFNRDAPKKYLLTVYGAVTKEEPPPAPAMAPVLVEYRTDTATSTVTNTMYRTVYPVPSGQSAQPNAKPDGKPHPKPSARPDPKQQQINYEKYIATMATRTRVIEEECGCEDDEKVQSLPPASTPSAPPVSMVTSVVPCNACGPNGENEVTITVSADCSDTETPASKPTAPISPPETPFNEPQAPASPPEAPATPAAPANTFVATAPSPGPVQGAGSSSWGELQWSAVLGMAVLAVAMVL